MSESDTPTPASEPKQPEPAAPTPASDTPDAPQAAPPAAEATAGSAATQAPAPQPETTPMPAPAAAGVHWGTGRRKSAVARVRLVPGSGKVLINKREVHEYFTEIKDRMAVTAPLELTGAQGMWDVLVNVKGGGFSGQAGAVRLGVARALVSANEAYEPTLRDAGYLTRDARRVERKKYGRRKARRSFQFSKR